MTKLIYLGVGSLLGGFARYFLAGALYKNFGTGFPHGTLAVNLLGCFLIGFFSALPDQKLFMGVDGRIFLIAGFCGAFTTFSTFMLETDSLIKYGQFFKALSYVVLSCVAGLLFFA